MEKMDSFYFQNPTAAPNTQGMRDFDHVSK